MSTRRVAVVGGGLGGLAAAAILARRGCDVHLFERSDKLGGKAETLTIDGLQFDTGPTLLTMPDTIARVFDAAGAVLPAYRTLEAQCVYHFGDRSFTAYADIARTEASVAEIFPDDASGVRTFFAAAEKLYEHAGRPYLEAPFTGMARYLSRSFGAAPFVWSLLTQSLADMARRHFPSPEMQQFAGRFATYVGTSPYLASPALAMIAHVERAFGVHHLPGGMVSLVDALAAAAKKHGATIHLSHEASWPMREFDETIVNADPLGDNGRPLALSGYVLLLAPLDLPHHSVRFSRDYKNEFDELMRGEIPSEPTLYLCRAPSSGVYAMINMPARAPFSQEDLGRAKEKILAQLPGAKVLHERTPNDFLKLGAPRGSIYGHLEVGAFGPFKRPRMRSDGVIYVGGGTHPGGGVPMVLTSGQFAADMLTAA